MSDEVFKFVGVIGKDTEGHNVIVSYYTDSEDMLATIQAAKQDALSLGLDITVNTSAVNGGLPNSTAPAGVSVPSGVKLDTPAGFNNPRPYRFDPDTNSWNLMQDGQVIEVIDGNGAIHSILVQVVPIDGIVRKTQYNVVEEEQEDGTKKNRKVATPRIEMYPEWRPKNSDTPFYGKWQVGRNFLNNDIDIRAFEVAFGLSLSDVPEMQGEFGEREKGNVDPDELYWEESPVYAVYSATFNDKGWLKADQFLFWQPADLGLSREPWIDDIYFDAPDGQPSVMDSYRAIVAEVMGDGFRPALSYKYPGKVVGAVDLNASADD